MLALDELVFRAEWFSFEQTFRAEKRGKLGTTEEQAWRARMSLLDIPADRFGVRFTLSSGWEAFATLRQPSVIVWLPTPCCGGVQGQDYTTFGSSVPHQCLACHTFLPRSYHVKWTPPISPNYNFPAQLADLLGDSLGVLEAALAAPEVAARMDRVFKSKILVAYSTPSTAFAAILARVSGPLFLPDPAAVAAG